MSVIWKSPPSLCSITILLLESTLATTFVKPAELIAPATKSASLVAAVVVTLTVTSEPNALEFGGIGDYAIVSTTTLNKLFYKNKSGTWVQVGSTAWISSWSTVTGTQSNPTITNGATMSINGSVVTSGGVALSDVVTAIGSAGISGITSAVVDGKLEIYSTGADVVLADNSSTLLSEIGLTAGTYKAPKLTIAPHTQVPGYKSTLLTNILISCVFNCGIIFTASGFKLKLT